MPLMEKGGIFTEPIFFPISFPFDVDQNIPLAIQLKNASACACTSFTLCTIKGKGKGKMKKQRKLDCSSQDVVEPNCGLLIENGFLVCRESSEVK